MPGIVTQIQRFSINDGPGIRTTVFFKGCPLRCKWCHNPECLSSHPEIYFRLGKCKGCGRCKEVCPERAIDLDQKPEMRIDRRICTLCMQCVRECRFGALSQVGEFLTEEVILNEVEKDLPFYRNSGGGMTLSGGEPLFQFDFALNLLTEAKKRGINTALDTCGYEHFGKFEMLLDLVDLILYDIKHINPVKHRKGTGLGNELILENCEKLSQKGVQMRVRLPLIPSFNDSSQDIEKTGRFLGFLGIKDIDLLPYHTYMTAKYEMLGRKYELDRLKVLADSRVDAIRRKFESKGLRTTIGG